MVKQPIDKPRLNELGPGIWIAEGPSVPFLGVPYPTRMTLARLADGRLWVCSPIALDEALVREVDALGRVAYLVSPNKIHHLYLDEWLEQWPSARLYASPGLAKRRRELSFHAELGDRPPPEWADEIDQVVVRGSLAMEEVLFFHRASRTAIVTDLIQRFDAAPLTRFQRFLMRFDGLVGPDGSTPREWRLSFWRRSTARRAVERALDWQPTRTVIAHGTLPAEDGRAALERGLRWLLRDGRRGSLRPWLEGVEGLVVLALAALSWPLSRRWLADWGSRPSERARSWPGDTLTPDCRESTTRAIEIDAPPQAVWPWIAQLGLDKGGFYSYELLERVAGIPVTNLERIEPSMQTIEIGTEVTLHPNEPPIRAAIVEPERCLCFEAEGDRSWSSYIEPQIEPEGASASRLILRSSIPPEPADSLLQRIQRALEAALDFTMEQRMLRTIRRLAESRMRTSLASARTHDTGGD